MAESRSKKKATKRPSSRKPTKAAKPKPAAPRKAAKKKSAAAPARTVPAPTPRKATRTESAEQQELPITKQDRCVKIETHWRKREDARKARADLKTEIDDHEEKIQEAFDEMDDDDPRRLGYRVATGHVLTPKLKQQLGITRPAKTTSEDDAENDGAESPAPDCEGDGE
jgi:hypothetical protein